MLIAQGISCAGFCDGTEALFPCEPDLIRQPCGLAVDRRGWLYVADPAAGRVIVLDAHNGTAIQVLSVGEEPVDVAISKSGIIFVADQAGRIFRYSSLFRSLGSFVAQNGSELPERPKPIAVMVDSNESVLVADAHYPRLLRFSHDGDPLADVEISAVASGLDSTDISLSALQAAYGPRKPLFKATSDCDCAPVDGPALLAKLHLKIRIAQLVRLRVFYSSGRYICRRLDGGAPGIQWHKILIDAVIPEETTLTIETVTSDQADLKPVHWDAARDSTAKLITFSEQIPDQLIQSKPGRYLWLRMILTSNGKATPSVRALRVFYPRNSPLELLPAHWQRNDESKHFLEHFLGLVEQFNTGIETTFENFIRSIHPDAATDELTDWLAALIDLAFDPSWSLKRRRALLTAAMELYQQRGTREGLRKYIEIYTGYSPVFLESYLERPSRSTYLGVPGIVLGCNTLLCSSAPSTIPDVELYNHYAHRFIVVLPLLDYCEMEVIQAVVNRIIEVNKPAHTEHRLDIVYPQTRVELQNRVGIDILVGAKTDSGLHLHFSIF